MSGESAIVAPANAATPSEGGEYGGARHRMLLRAEGLRVNYGVVRAVQDVSLHLSESQLVAVIGLNGAGKSTLVKALMGLVRLAAGKLQVHHLGAWVDLQKVQSWDRPRRAGLAYVPERQGVFPRLSVGDNLRLGMEVGRDRSSDGEDELQSLIDEFPVLRRRWNEPAGNLSGGEQQTTAIVRALLMRPTTLLLDEPSTGLSPNALERIFAMLHTKLESSTSRGRPFSVLLTEQRADIALEFAHYAYVLEKGRVAVEGKPDDLVSGDYLVQAFLGGAK